MNRRSWLKVLTIGLIGGNLPEIPEVVAKGAPEVPHHDFKLPCQEGDCPAKTQLPTPYGIGEKWSFILECRAFRCLAEIKFPCPFDRPATNAAVIRHLPVYNTAIGPGQIIDLEPGTRYTYPNP